VFHSYFWCGRLEMAWEQFKVGAISGITGDQPHDEMRNTVKRINRAYMERFGRRPYFAELLYVLENVIGSDLRNSVTDESLPDRACFFSCLGHLPFEHIDPGQYVGAFDAESDDFLIFPRPDCSGQLVRETVVVRGEVVVNNDRDLLCRYAILSRSMTERMAQSLIRQCVLQDLMDYNVVDGDLVIRFEKAK
jgi:hypothetical protein